MSTYNQEQGDITRIKVEKNPAGVVVPTEEVVDAPAEEVVEEVVEEVPVEPVKKKK